MNETPRPAAGPQGRRVGTVTVGVTITEGRLDTFPDVGSTCLEPWRNDSADS